MAAVPRPNVLLLATGSVATIKLPLLVSLLQEQPLNVQVILTPSAERFLPPDVQQALAARVKVWRNEDEWARPWARGDSVLHIELRKWADLMLIAPLSANSLGAIASGLCNGLGLSVVRAWDTTGCVGNRAPGGTQPAEQTAQPKLILVAPAMNTQMFLHPLTAQQLAVLESWHWFEVLRPIEKALACGDVGVGAMCEPQQLVNTVLVRLGLAVAEVLEG